MRDSFLAMLQISLFFSKNLLKPWNTKFQCLTMLIFFVKVKDKYVFLIPQTLFSVQFG